MKQPSMKSVGATIVMIMVVLCVMLGIAIGYAIAPGDPRDPGTSQ